MGPFYPSKILWTGSSSRVNSLPETRYIVKWLNSCLVPASLFAVVKEVRLINDVGLAYFESGGLGKGRSNIPSNGRRGLEGGSWLE
jgi:hypothetical protein